MSENKEKEASDPGEKILGSLTNSIEIVIRYFMTGVAVCVAVYLSSHNLSKFNDEILSPYQVNAGVALIVGFFSFALYRVFSWQIIDYFAWRAGISAPAHFKSTKLGATDPFAKFLRWRYEEKSIPQSLGGYLTFRWSMIHFLIIATFAWLLAACFAEKSSFIGSQKCLIFPFALFFFVITWFQFVFLLKVELNLCEQTTKKV